VISKRKLKKFLILTIIILIPLFLNISLIYFDSFKEYFTIEDQNYLHTSRVVEHNNQNWIDNPNFDGLGVPWFSLTSGDSRDVDASINLGQANLGIQGDIRTFNEISGIPLSSEWIEYNHSVRPLPLTHEINQYGCNVSHAYDEGNGRAPNSGDQTANLAGVLWKRNITLPVDMSDYIITTASINAIVNGSADMNIETPSDHPPFDTGGYASLFDFARFYVEISDLNDIEHYEIAHNKTLNLGEGYANRVFNDWDSRNFMSDTNMTSVDEDILIFDLIQVLKHDNYNFTITLGIEIDCEDNYLNYELDWWYSLLIKSCDLSFTYVKKIDQSTSVSWNQIGERVSGTNVQITNANLKFNYKIDQLWPTSLSPNSEIRILINDRQYSETIKLSLATTSFQEAKVGGYDITSLIPLTEDVKLSIQVYLADEFALEQKLTLSIDEAYLEISWTETFPNPFAEPWIATGLFIIVLFAATALGGYLIAYQKYLKYPIPIRKVRKYRKTLTREKDPDVRTIRRKRAFSKSFQAELDKSSKYLKGTPLDGKLLRNKLLGKQNGTSIKSPDK